MCLEAAGFAVVLGGVLLATGAAVVLGGAATVTVDGAEVVLGGAATVAPEVLGGAPVDTVYVVEPVVVSANTGAAMIVQIIANAIVFVVFMI